MKKHNISILQSLRHLVQLIFFILLPGLYINAFSGVNQIYLAILNHSNSFAQLLPQLIEVASIIPLTILLGRFFCGWMCSFGSFGDLIYGVSSKLFKRRFKMNPKADYFLKYIKYVILIFLIAVIWTLDVTAFTSYNPWDVFGMIAAFGKVPDFTYIASNLKAGLVIFVFIVIGSSLVERFFCRYLCPLGAIFSLTSKLRIVKISKPTTNCGSCIVCTTNCAMGIALCKNDKISSGECIQCMKCITVCPRKNATVKVSEKDVRPILAGAAAVSVITGFYYAGNIGINAAGLNTASPTTTSSNQTLYSSTALYLDGTYEGTGTGFRGAQTTVSVVVKNGKITDITTVSTGDDKPFYNRAFTTVSDEIISSQSTEVDSVSRATFSSNGIMAAVENALSNAKITSSSISDSSTNTTTSTVGNSEAQVQSTSLSSSTSYSDGTYEGTGTGFRGAQTIVSVVVKSGKITNITTVSTGDDKPFYNRAFTTVSDEIISNQSTDVDSVSGATFSSNGIMEAVADALK